VRGRIENWDWFEAPPAQNSYTYGIGLLRLNLGKSSTAWDWQVDVSFPAILNLPQHAIAPFPQGPQGYGGDYFAANGQSNTAAAVIRQAFATFKTPGKNLKLRIGRWEFADGAEAVPEDPALAALKRERINQRLIGAFNYALRSFDGAQLAYGRGHSNTTILGARVVEGSFQLRAFREMNVDLWYASHTRFISSGRARSEARLFVLHYHDGRGVIKSDNRPQQTLQTDTRPIRLTTAGGHFISAIPAGPGNANFLVWAAGQFGQWGLQRHIASELAAETGYRFSVKTEPWIRAGYFRSSGDPDPNDSRHNTFFQVLSSPRAYARSPFYILMNAEDRFGQFGLTPVSGLTLRSELHVVCLTQPRDLWYDGGGAFQDQTFGYLGRPSGEKHGVGTSLDLSADVSVSRNATLSLFAGVMRGNAVSAFVFPAGGQRPVLRLLSIEFIRRF
jgi:hypothetical protein